MTAVDVSTKAVGEPRAKVYMKAREAAEYLSLSQSYLAQLRMTGDGPPFRMFGRAVRYRREDIDAWTDERLRRSTQGGTVAGAR